MAQGQRTGNQALLPQARQALDQFKYEVAQEIFPQYGIQLPQGGYWGEIPSRLNGAVGGHMVRRMIAAAEQALVEQTTAGVRAGFRGAFQGGNALGGFQDVTAPTAQQLGGQQTPKQV